MAITRAQQFKQMLQDGGRIGFRGGDAARSDAASGRNAGRADPSGGVERPGGGGGNNNQQTVTAPVNIPKPVKDAINLGGDISYLKNLIELNPVGIMKNIGGKIIMDKIFGDQTSLDTEDDNNMLLADALTTPTADTMGLNLMDRKTLKDAGYSNSQIQELQDNPNINTQDVIRDIKGPIFAAADGGRIGLQEGGGIEQRLEQLGGDVSSAEQLLQGINKRLETAESSLGSGGATYELAGGMTTTQPPLNLAQNPQLPAGGLGSLESLNMGLPNSNVFKDPVTGGGQPFFMGNMNYMGGPNDKLTPIDPYKNTQLAGLSQDGQRFDSVQSAFDALAEQTQKQREITPNTRDVIGTELFQGAEGFKNFTNMFNKINDPSYVAPSPQLLSAQGTSGVPALGFADGGRIGAAEGGIMDLETGRQMYFLGKLVKKATRAVKKVVKSPIGKAALLYAGGAGLAGLGTGTSFMSNLMSPTSLFRNLATSGKGFLTGISGGALQFPGAAVASNAPGAFKLGEFLRTPKGILTGITAASTVAGALTEEQEDQAQQLADNTGFSIEEARNAILQAAKENYAMDVRARGFKADGGIMRAGYQEGSKEPVAKKTMPLLDMGGKEMDLREDGGFVPIGRMEKADDVPARLSKNEFVFTADAVRNAGDGNVDKGAEVMYNMMKNLESGGDVSEESQGLSGARRMFQTSQRLEEVL